MRQSVEKSRIYQLANSIKTLEGLKQFFYFSEEEEKHIQNILRTTRMSITPYLINLIETEKGRIKTNDPIWLQYGPSLYEGELLEETTSREKENEMFGHGLIDISKVKNSKYFLGQHKYPDKVVVRISHYCGAFCRFCYERGRTLNNAKMVNLLEARKQAVEYIQLHPQIREVILTGGDPLTLTDDMLEDRIQTFYDISNIKSIRIHTRMPAQNPYRITNELISIFVKYNIKWLNIQINHPRELTQELLDHIRLLQKEGITVKTENPIIRNINDDPKTIAKLISICRDNGIQNHHWFHSMPITPNKMKISVERMILIFQHVKKELGGIRRNYSELGDLVIPHYNGKRTIPFEEININISKPRQERGTNNFKFMVNKNSEAIIAFSSRDHNSTEWSEYIDPNINLNNIKNSDFIDLL